MLAGAIISIDDGGASARLQIPSAAVTVIRRRASGGFVIATEHELVATSESLDPVEIIAKFTEDPRARSNDGGCDPLGNFVLGTMFHDETPGAGKLFRIGRDHSVSEILSPVSISNGVQWSMDGTSAFYVDTPTRRIDRFDFDLETGGWSDRRPHVTVDDSCGSPDGLAIDEEDGLWVALWGGGAVHHYDSDGFLVERVLVPGVTQVTSCAFGGVSRGILYITTSRVGVPASSEPDAGAVFAVQTRSRGARLHEYLG